MKPFTFLLLCFILGISSCVDDDACPDIDSHNYFYLTAKETSKVPYTGKDTLRFVNNTGDTAIFIGQIVPQSFFTESDRPYPDCSYVSYHHYEVFGIDYISTNSIFIISLRDQKKTESTSGTNTLFITIENTQFQLANHTIDLSSAYNFIDSIEIQNTMYYRVGKWADQTGNLDLYLNKKFGILKFETATSGIWERIN